MDNKTSPQLLLDYAKGYIELYELVYSNSPKISNNAKHSAAICFFFGLEFYLKAYLCSLDSKFYDNNELSKLGHNFNKIFCALTRSAELKDLTEIKKVIKLYNLFEVDVVELRYPEAGTQLLWPRDFYEGKHECDVFFRELDAKIRANYLKQLIVDTNKT